MKTLLKLPLLCAAFAAGASSLPAADPAPAPAEGHPRLRALLQRRASLRQRIAQHLGLTAGQITRLKAARAKTVAAVKAIRADSNLAPDQKKAKLRDTLLAARTEMRGVLTPDQQAQWDKIRQHLRSRLGKA